MRSLTASRNCAFLRLCARIGVCDWRTARLAACNAPQFKFNRQRGNPFWRGRFRFSSRKRGMPDGRGGRGVPGLAQVPSQGRLFHGIAALQTAGQPDGGGGNGDERSESCGVSAPAIGRLPRRVRQAEQTLHPLRQIGTKTAAFDAHPTRDTHPAHLLAQSHQASGQNGGAFGENRGGLVGGQFAGAMRRRRAHQACGCHHKAALLTSASKYHSGSRDAKSASSCASMASCSGRLNLAAK